MRKPGKGTSRNSREYQPQISLPFPLENSISLPFTNLGKEIASWESGREMLTFFTVLHISFVKLTHGPWVMSHESWYPWQLPLYYLVKVKNQFKTGILQKVRVRDHCMFSSQMVALLSNNEILFESYHTKLFLYYSRSRFPPFPGIAAKISLPVGKFHFTSRKTEIFLIPVLFYQGW